MLSPRSSVLGIALHTHSYIQCGLVCNGGLESIFHRKSKAVVDCNVEPQLFMKAKVKLTYI
jgi:hypothetical protein